MHEALFLFLLFCYPCERILLLLRQCHNVPYLQHLLIIAPCYRIDGCYVLLLFFKTGFLPV